MSKKILEVTEETTLVKHCQQALAMAFENRSKLEAIFLSMHGMSGKQMRHFLNNLCSGENIRQLEIGVHTGSSFCAALYKNAIEEAVAIDNFSEFATIDTSVGKVANIKDTFINNMEQANEDGAGKNRIKFVNSDCFNVDLGLLGGPFNVYFYDGNHTYESQYKALQYFTDVLAEEFVFIIDDWNWEDVRNATERVIVESGFEVLFRFERQTDVEKEGELQNSLWHNGVAVFVLRKSGAGGGKI